MLEKLNLLTHLNIIKNFLGELAATLSENEENSIKHLTKQFFNQHSYFSEVWKYLGNSQKNKILVTIGEGKGIIPHEKIVNMNSMFVTPEKMMSFFKKVNSAVI